MGLKELNRNLKTLLIITLSILLLSFFISIYIVFVYIYNSSNSTPLPIENSQITPSLYNFSIPRSQRIKCTENLWKRCLNESADPCHDFYNFACGNYEPDLSKFNSNDTYKYLSNEYDLELEKCLNDTLLDNDYKIHSTAVQKMRQFQNAYFNFKKNQTKLPISQLLNEINSFGGCKLFNPNWSSDNFDLSTTLLKLSELTGRFDLFNFKIDVASRNVALFFVEPLNSTNFEYDKLFQSNGSLDNDFKTALLKFISKVNFLATESEMTVDNNYLFDTLEKLIAIDLQVNAILNNASYYYSEHSFNIDKYGNVINLEHVPNEQIKFNELNDLLPIIGGSNYFMNNAQILPDVRSYLAKNPFIYVKSKKLLSKLNGYFSSLGKELLANYLCVNYISSQIEYFGFNTKKYLDKNSLKINNESRTEDIEDDLMDNIELTKGYFPSVVDYFFIDECVHAKSIKIIKQTVKQIKWASKKMLTKTEWLDEESRKNVLLKLESMNNFIGAYNISMSVQELDKYYDSLNFSNSDTYREMILKGRLFTRQQELQLIFNPEQTIKKHIKQVFVQGAGFLNQYNAFYISGAFMFPPNFDFKMPKNVQFGSAGFIIGHEMFHALDSLGFNCDAYGAFNPLFTNQTLTKFNKRFQCLIEQFDKLENVETYGKRTLDENIADLMGLQVAYLAYKLFGETNEVVPGFEHYNSDEAFFIGYANKWCEKMTHEEYLDLIETDSHSLPKYRVNEVLKNMPEFAKAFKCPFGSKMNPEKKCKIY